MIQKSLSLTLITLLLQMICVTPIFSQQTDAESQRVAKLKERLNTIGVVQKKRVVVTRTDGTKLDGRVSRMQEDSFVITDNKTGVDTTVAYDNVAQVKGKGGGLSTAAKIGIGVGVAIVAAVVIIGIGFSRSCPTAIPCRQ